MKLQAKPRLLVGKKVSQLRTNNLVPAAVYGPIVESTNIEFNAKDFTKLFDKVGYSKFFDLEIEGGKTHKVLVKSVDIHPINDNYQTVNLYAVDETRRVTVEIPIEFIGEAPAVKLNLGFLVHQMDSITVSCLPKDLPGNFVVDISNLNNPGDSVSIQSIVLPENVEFASSVDVHSAMVFIAAPQRQEEEDIAAEEAAATAEAEASAAAATPTGEDAKAEVKK